MTQKTYKLGVLGVGEGRSILHGCDRSDDWQTAWICDLDEDLCKQRMEEHHVERYTLRFEEMLADPELDVVAIYTPDPMHADHCIQALDAGKHVICTKPLVDDLSRGRELLDAVEASGKRLMVGMSCRFFESFMQQRQLLEQKPLGQLLSVEAHYHGDKRVGTSGKWGKERANNWIYTGLVHPADLVYWHSGLPEEVFGYGSVSPAMQGRGYDVPDNFHFVLKGRDGVLNTVSGLYGTPSAHPGAEACIECTLRGAEGVVEARFPTFELNANYDGEDPCQWTYSHRHSYYYPWGGSMHHAGEFQNYLEYFARHLDAGTCPLPDAGDGLRIISVLRAMELSMTSGEAVRPADLLKEHHLNELVNTHD